MRIYIELLGKILDKDGEETDIIDVLMMCWVRNIFSAVIPVFLNTIGVHYNAILLICYGIKPAKCQASFHALTSTATSMKNEDQRWGDIIW
jgi:hypothetical protein